MHVGMEEAVADGVPQEALQQRLRASSLRSSPAASSAAKSRIGMPSTQLVVSTVSAVWSQLTRG